MPALASRFLWLLILAVYTATSIGPRGAAICLGGGHEWDEVIAARCEHGGHGHSEASAIGHEHPGCAGCDHHQSEDHGPCTDIPLGSDDGRPGTSQSSAKTSMHAADQASPSASAWAAPGPRLALSASAWPRRLDLTRGLHQVTASLRAVVLVI